MQSIGVTPVGLPFCCILNTVPQIYDLNINLITILNGFIYKTQTNILARHLVRFLMTRSKPKQLLSNLTRLSHIRFWSNTPATIISSFTGISYSLNSTPKSGWLPLASASKVFFLLPPPSQCQQEAFKDKLQLWYSTLGQHPCVMFLIGSLLYGSFNEVHLQMLSWHDTMAPPHKGITCAIVLLNSLSRACQLLYMLLIMLSIPSSRRAVCCQI